LSKIASPFNLRDVLELSLRRVKFIVTLLLVLSAFAATTAQANIFTTLPQVKATPSISLTPTTAEAGAHVTVGGSGFLTTDTSCTVSSVGFDANGHNAILPGTAACVTAGTGIVNGSFTIGNVLPGQYVIEVTGCPGNNGCTPSAGDFAQALLNVTSGPSITLTPAKGPPGLHVTVGGSGYLPTDTSCTITSVGFDLNGHGPLLPGTAACVIVVGSGIVNGSFTIGNVLPGQYVIEVTGCLGNNGCAPSVGDFAQALLNVTSGPSITLTPAKGPPGLDVNVGGSGFLPTDTSCTVTSVGFDLNGNAALLPGTAACVVVVGSGIVNGSFRIGNVLPGQYVIEVTGCLGNNGCYPSSGDYAQALLNVTVGPAITLTPSIARTGAHISVSGTGFLPTDTSCSLSGSLNVMASGTAACVISVGTGTVTGSFIISDVQPGQYVIEVTGCLGNNGCAPSAGDFAQAVLNVTSGPSIYLTPVIGGTGTHVLVNGTGFLPSDTSCVLVSGASNLVDPILAGTAACVIREGTGVVNGSFTVGNVPPGQYVIEVDASSAIITTITTTFSTTTTVTTSTATTTTFTSTTNVQIDVAQAIFDVSSGPKISLTPTTGQPGVHVTVGGSGYLPTDTSCTVSSVGNDANGHSPLLPGTAACVISVGTGIVNGSFTIGNVLPGQYIIEITGCLGNNGCVASVGDFAQAVITVMSGPSITLTPANAQSAAHVTVGGSGFLPTDTSCTLSTLGVDINGHTAIMAGTAACVIVVGTGIVNGSFTIGNVLPGQYVIEVTGCLGNNGCTPSVGDFAQALLNVTKGPSITLTPTKGPPGLDVTVGGSGYLPTDTSCTITSVGFDANGHSPLLAGSAACATIAGTGIVNGSFTIGNVLPGQYVIEITGCVGNNGCVASSGDFSQAVLTVMSGPTITLTPAKGAPGLDVTVGGSGYLPTDTSCTISSVGNDANGHSPLLAGSAACAIIVGSGIVNGSFTIGNVLPGQYIIEITGCLGNNGCTPSAGDFAQAVLTVAGGPSITLTPTKGQPGAAILVGGSGYLPTDTSCTLSNVGNDANGHSPILSGTASCVIVVSSGIVNGSFTIGNVLPGQYIIEITGCLGNNGCAPSVGDFAQANLIVNNTGPRLTLIPKSGPVGTSVVINGTGFLPTDQSCSISGSGNGNVFNPVLAGSAACAIAVGTGIVNGSFIIGNVSPGEYLIEVTGCLGNTGCAPSAGDFVLQVLTVNATLSPLVLFPSNSTESSTVTFTADGLSPTDTSCTVLAYNYKGPGVAPSGLPPPGALDNNLITSPTCSIITPTIAQGSFVVSPYATTNTNWNVTVRGSPVNDYGGWAVFNVTADVIVTPTSGTVNTVFTFTGSGFSGTASSCTATIFPPFPVIPSTTAITIISAGTSTTTTAIGTSTTAAGGTSTTTVAVGTSTTAVQVETSTQIGAGCYVSAGIGQVSGSVIVPGDASPGTYGILVTAVNATGFANTGTGIFTVGTPSALVVLNPASVEQGQPVGAAGFGFNPADAYCTISSSAGNALFQPNTPVTCQISGGYASGAFTVSPLASGGYYLISIIACEVQPSGNVCPAGASLDFASNFLGVTLATTVTTYSTTTSTSSITTSLSTTTTSVATSFSYSSTTFSTTGILFTTYSQFTVNTVSGVLTTTYSQTSYTTQTQTTVTYSTTTQYTTIPCGPLPCGFSTQPVPFNPAPGIDSVGLMAALLLLIPMLLRRLFT